MKTILDKLRNKSILKNIQCDIKHNRPRNIEKNIQIDTLNQSITIPKKQERDMITVAMCTQPHRKKSMLRVVNSLLPQCDRMCICFNEYDEIPKELPKSDKLICVLAGDGREYEDLGCMNKMLWCGDFEGYYATVDDDLYYPDNYISELKKKVDYYNRKCICSVHGCIFEVNDGILNTKKRKVFPYCISHEGDHIVHKCGMGVAMYCPKEIGLDKSIYLSKPKNFGDDETTSVWALQNNVCIYVIDNTNIRMGYDKVALTGLYSNKDEFEKRQTYLQTVDTWQDIKDDVFFRIIIPTYNTSDFLERCLNSIKNQTFKNYRVVIVDDNSNIENISKTREIVIKYPFCTFIENNYRSNAGGCRNKGMEFYKESKYTLFLDSDDCYASENSLQNIYQNIIDNNYPDAIRCSYNVLRNNKVKSYILNSNVLDDLKKYNYTSIAPWTLCTKTTLCPFFKAYRRCCNDVVWFIRCMNICKNISYVGTPIVNYIKDNPLSYWANQNTLIDPNITAAKYYVVADLYSEQFTTETSNQLKELYITKYKNEILKSLNNLK